MRLESILLALGLAIAPAPTADTMKLIEIRDQSDVAAWRPVHDGVMGGLSSGRSLLVEGAARFEGRVSLDNNGGFASFRVAARLPDLSDYDGLRLRVRGDGQVYKLSLRTDDGWDGIGWQASFTTRDSQWIDVDLAFAELTPSWRGRLVSDAGPFDPSSIQEVGLVIADKQEGPFVLELDSVEAWRATSSSSLDRHRVAERTRTEALAALVDEGKNGQELANAMLGNERLVVVAAPEELGAEASKQLGSLLARAPELADRQLRTLHLMGNGAGRMAGRTLSGEQVRELRQRWQLPPNEWLVALVGKDGEVKASFTRVVDAGEIFALIDAMPMRQRELE